MRNLPLLTIIRNNDFGEPSIDILETFWSRLSFHYDTLSIMYMRFVGTAYKAFLNAFPALRGVRRSLSIPQQQLIF